MAHMMPEIDGVEATKMIRELDNEYYRKLPIIALTANAINGVHERVNTCGKVENRCNNRLRLRFASVNA